MIGSRLRVLRKARGETLLETARGLGISESLLSRVENGRRLPSLEVVSNAANYFDVDEATLLGSHITAVAASLDVRHDGGLPSPHIGHDIGLSTHPEAFIIAEAALSSALGSLLEDAASADHTHRYRACRSLAELASRPLDALLHLCVKDDDPVLREAAAQVLGTLLDAYEVRH